MVSAVLSNEKYCHCHGCDDDQLVKTDEAKSDETLGSVDCLWCCQRGVDQSYTDTQPQSVLPLSQSPVSTVHNASTIRVYYE